MARRLRSARGRADGRRDAVGAVEHRRAGRGSRRCDRRRRRRACGSARRPGGCGRSRDRRTAACRRARRARSRLSMAMLTPAQKPRGLARMIFTAVLPGKGWMRSTSADPYPITTVKAVGRQPQGCPIRDPRNAKQRRSPGCFAFRLRNTAWFKARAKRVTRRAGRAGSVSDRSTASASACGLRSLTLPARHPSGRSRSRLACCYPSFERRRNTAPSTPTPPDRACRRVALALAITVAQSYLTPSLSGLM